MTFPRDDIARLSGMTMPVNKRNWRKQKEHLRRARAVQDIDYPNHEWAGRPSAQNQVWEWRQRHPGGRKADCHRDTGLDPKTIRKWWDCPPTPLRFEDDYMADGGSGPG